MSGKIGKVTWTSSGLKGGLFVKSTVNGKEKPPIGTSKNGICARGIFNLSATTSIERGGGLISYIKE